MPQVAGIRRFGAAALDLAWVAAGRYDGFWELGLKRWDMAAGLLLVREAAASPPTRTARTRATPATWSPPTRICTPLLSDAVVRRHRAKSACGRTETACVRCRRAAFPRYPDAHATKLHPC